MFTEYEIATMIGDEEILKATEELKKDFIRKEAPYLEVNDHDFFSLIMLAPYCRYGPGKWQCKPI